MIKVTLNGKIMESIQQINFFPDGTLATIVADGIKYSYCDGIEITYV